MVKPVGMVTSEDGETYEIYAFLDSDLDPIDPEVDGPEDVAYVVIMTDGHYIAFPTHPPERIEVH